MNTEGSLEQLMVMRDKAKRVAIQALWPLFPAHRQQKLAGYKEQLETFRRWVAGPDLVFPTLPFSELTEADSGACEKIPATMDATTAFSDEQLPQLPACGNANRPPLLRSSAFRCSFRLSDISTFRQESGVDPFVVR